MASTNSYPAFLTSWPHKASLPVENRYYTLYNNKVKQLVCMPRDTLKTLPGVQINSLRTYMQRENSKVNKLL